MNEVETDVSGLLIKSCMTVANYIKMLKLLYFQWCLKAQRNVHCFYFDAFSLQLYCSLYYIDVAIVRRIETSYTFN